MTEFYGLRSGSCFKVPGLSALFCKIDNRQFAPVLRPHDVRLVYSTTALVGFKENTQVIPFRPLVYGQALYKHDCSSCIFLGNGFHYVDESNTGDGYWCYQVGIPTLIVRFSDEPEDYASGTAAFGPNHPLRLTAQSLGLL